MVAIGIYLNRLADNNVLILSGEARLVGWSRLMLYSGFSILPRSVFWSASFNGRSDNTDVMRLKPMTLTKPESDLLSATDLAFDGVVLGDGISLYVASMEAGPGTPVPELLNADETNWRLIPDDVLEKAQTTFSFTDLAGYRFYLPRYITWAIHNHRTSSNWISDHTIYSIDPTMHHFNKTPFLEFLSPEQVDVALAFLDYCILNPDTNDATIAAKNASAIRLLRTGV